MTEGNRNTVLNWLIIAILSISLMGVFAVEVSLARAPMFQDHFSSPDFFYRALCIHVVFAMILWLLVFNISIWHYYFPIKKTRLSKVTIWATVLSLTMLTIVGVFDLGKPYLNNYIPVVDHPIFWVALILFALVYLFEIIRFLPRLKLLFMGNSEDQLIFMSLVLSIIYVISSIIGVITADAVDDMKLYYEKMFWVSGHVQQFLNASIMILCWHFLTRKSNSLLNQGIKNNLWLKFANFSLLIMTLPLLLGLFVDPLTTNFRYVSVLSYGLGLGIPILIHTVFLIKKMILRNFAGFTLLLSLVLYYSGVIIAYGGMKSDLRITAHYHGVVTALTVALMGLAFYFLKERKLLKYERIAKLQPLIYAIGMLLVIVGLFLAGYYGAPRKTFGFKWIFDNSVINYLNILGVGAAISIIGGVMFVIYVLRSFIIKTPQSKVFKLLLIPLTFILSSFDLPNENKILGTTIANIEVVNENGTKSNLHDYIKDEPILLSPIYTKCPNSCSLITANLKDALEKTTGYGKKFTVLTFSFDHTDQPKDLQVFKERWELEGKPWKIVSANEENTKELLKSIDFQIDIIDATGEYAHPNLAVIITPEKKISRYIHGIFPNESTIDIAVLEAKNEKTSLSFFEGLYLKCFEYDPITGEYHIDWSFIIQIIAGIVVIGGMLTFLCAKPLIDMI